MAEQDTVEEYIESMDRWQAEVAIELDRIVREVVPGVQKVIKWKQPTYEYQGLLCYFKEFKNHINFGFFRGSELDDPHGLLEGTGDKMRHVKIKSLQDVNDKLKELVTAAVKLNVSGN